MTGNRTKWLGGLGVTILVALLCFEVLPAQEPVDPDVVDFRVETDGTVGSIALDARGGILAGGGFRKVAGFDRRGLCRLDRDGVLDQSFGRDTWDGVDAIAVIHTGKILVGSWSEGLRSLNSDGSPDAAFEPVVGIGLRCLAVQADGKILGGGWDFVFRLLPDGTVDPDFHVDVDEPVLMVLLQNDGKILVGGMFTRVNGVQVNGLVRLHADGGVDTSFNPPADRMFHPRAIQADGKVLVASEADRTERHTERLNADGSLDEGFFQEQQAFALAVQADGKILLAGISRRVLRLNEDGSVDSTFGPRMTDLPAIAHLALQADGKILAGQPLLTVSITTDHRIVRFHNTSPATQSLTADDASVTWMRGGTAPEVWRTTFEHSDGGATWTMLGAGSRIDGGWELNEIDVPERGELRARGFVQTVSSSWFVETIVPLGLTAPLLKASWDQGDLRLTVYGDVGTGYAIEASDQLGMGEDWQTLTEEPMPSNPWEIVDGNGEGSSSRFYRVREVAAE